MNAHTYKRNGNEGMALMVATIFVALAVLVLGALSIMVINQSRQVDQYVTFNECLSGAEAGLLQSRAELLAGQDGAVGVAAWNPNPEGPVQWPAFDDENVQPISMPNLSHIAFFTVANDWALDGRDNNGDGVIDDTEEANFVTVFSSARSRGVDRALEEVLRREDINVWRNAIFAGSGQAGGLINGNVSIHGSVHLLGDQLLEGAEAIAAIDLSGTSLIHNNYQGLDAGLRARVPALPQRSFAAETVDTLNSKLRVRNGLVGLSGNSEVGEPQTAGNGWKETMDGTYVQNGWTGTAVVDDGDRGDPKSVFSDNGWDVGYDAGSRVSLPLLDDDWREMFTGEFQYNEAQSRNYYHDEYFMEVISGTAYPGNVVIKANQNFYYNASKPADPDPSHREPDDDFILFDAATNVMQINGQVTINGDLTITRGAGNDKTISYTGRAALLVNGTVKLDTDLLAVNADGTTVQTFPVNNIIGIMARDDMIVGSLSQLTLMGAYYAQGQIRSEKQTTVLGTFVSNYFDMGTNVPSIYQVPELADNLPYGMIGAYPIWMYARVSWREVGA